MHVMWIKTIFLLIIVSLPLACNQVPEAKPAPLGDYAALEKLAAAYRQVAEQYPVQPRVMRPEGRKEFVQKVFTAAGYDYTETLSHMAQQGVDMTNQDHRDLAELVLLPHQGLSDEDREDIYSAEELTSIGAIEAALH